MVQETSAEWASTPKPVPIKERDPSGPELLLALTLAEIAPVFDGVKMIVPVAVCLEFKVNGSDIPLTVNSPSFTTNWVTVTPAEPLLTMETLSDLGEPVGTLPKSRLVAVKLNEDEGGGGGGGVMLELPPPHPANNANTPAKPKNRAQRRKANTFKISFGLQTAKYLWTALLFSRKQFVPKQNFTNLSTCTSNLDK